MSKLIVFKGLPGSGKTTLAMELLQADGNCVRVNRDDLRRMMFGDRKWSGHQEKIVKYMQTVIAAHQLVEGKNVIIDDTNLLGGGVGRWKQWAKDSPTFGNAYYGDAADDCGPTVKRPTVEVIDLTHVTIAECIERDAKRIGRARVGRGVIERMALEGGLIDLSKHDKVAIVDLDGTIADCRHRLHYLQATPKDYHNFYGKVLLDGYFLKVIYAVLALHRNGYTIINVSGRPQVLAEDPDINIGYMTNRWLKAAGIPSDYLFMRRSGDYRPDTVVKREIWDAMVTAGLRKESVKVCLDDRPGIVALWADLGLPTIQVYNDGVVCGYNDGEGELNKNLLGIPYTTEQPKEF